MTPTPLPTRIAAGLLATGVIAALSGCSGDTQTSAEPASSFTIVVPGTSDDAGNVKIANAYAQASGIEVKVETISPDQYDQTVRTQLSAGSAADVISITPGQLAPTSVISLAKANLLAPVTDEQANRALVKGTESLFTVDDQLYAVPTSIVATGLIENTMTAESAGLSPAADLEEMISQCKTTGGNPALITLGGNAAMSASVLVTEIAANTVYASSPDWNAQRASDQVTFANTPGWAEAFTQMQQLIDAGCFQEGAAAAAFPEMVGSFMQGAAVNVAMPSLLAAELGASAPAGALKLAVHPFPAASGTTSQLIAGPSAGFAVNAAADPAAQAAGQKFLSWIADPANAQEIAEFEGGVPITAVGDASQVPELYAPIAEQIAAGDFIAMPSYDWTNPEVNDALGQGVQALMSGQGDVQSVLAAMDAAWSA